MQISDIKQGSVADRCGVLALGDKILSINNQLLAKCSLQEALNILHSSADTVFLEVEKQFDNNGEYLLNKIIPIDNDEKDYRSTSITHDEFLSYSYFYCNFPGKLNWFIFLESFISN